MSDTKKTIRGIVDDVSIVLAGLERIRVTFSIHHRAYSLLKKLDPPDDQVLAESGEPVTPGWWVYRPGVSRTVVVYVSDGKPLSYQLLSDTPRPVAEAKGTFIRRLELDAEAGA